MQLLHCENLSFSYDGKVAVKDVTFSISSGEYICIVGENGSGKSTLVKGLLQLHPPSGGTLRLGDCLKGGIGYLPQQKTSWKHFPASVLEVTLSGCLNRMKLRPFYGKKEKQQAMENLERMGIAHLHRHCFRELSGGQQQRVLLARALCAAKHLLILDEPIASLDPIAAKEFYEQIQRLHTELHRDDLPADLCGIFSIGCHRDISRRLIERSPLFQQPADKLQYTSLAYLNLGWV